MVYDLRRLHGGEVKKRSFCSKPFYTSSEAASSARTEPECGQTAVPANASLTPPRFSEQH